MRALAVSGWVCAVLASPAQVVTPWRYLDAAGVYQMWRDYVSADPDLEAVFASCHDASEMWRVYNEGFQVRPLYQGHLTIRGNLVVQDRLAYIAAYPVVSTVAPFAYSVVPFPTPFAYDYANLSDVPPLARSAWDILGTYATNQTPNGQTVQLATDRILSRQPHGRLLGSHYRLLWDNAPVGQLGALVRAGPVWWANLTDYCITPGTYHEITGEWPDEDVRSQTCVLLTEQMRRHFQTNATVTIGERWK